MIAVKCLGLLDGTGGQRARTFILIDRGEFTGICGWEDQGRFGTDIQLIDHSNSYVVPGLIDSHLHLSYTGNEPSMAEVGLRNERLLLQAAANVQMALHSGVTTVADCGAKDKILFSLRDAIQEGILPGSRILSCGKPITITGGHCHYLSVEADTPWETRKAARQVIKEGADFVKVMATGGSEVPGVLGEGYVNWNRYPAYTVEEIRPVVEEAHRLDRKVVAHCLSAEGMRNAVRAGVDVIAHAPFIQADGKPRFDADLAMLMAGKEIIVVPTLSVFSRRVEALKRKENPSTSEKEEIEAYQMRLDIVNRLVKANVRIAAGTDAGFSGVHHGEISRELALLVRAGLTPLQTLTAATKNASDSLGIGERIGTIERGKIADFLVLKEDPSRNIAVFHSIEAIYAAGRRVFLHGTEVFA